MRFFKKAYSSNLFALCNCELNDIIIHFEKYYEQKLILFFKYTFCREFHTHNIQVTITIYGKINIYIKIQCTVKTSLYDGDVITINFITME